MANELDEMQDQSLQEGRDVNVINKCLPIKVGFGSKLFEWSFILYLLPSLIASILNLTHKTNINQIVLLVLLVAGLLPLIIYQVKKVTAGNYLSQLQQKIQKEASQVDNYLEQRVQILQNTAQLVEKSISLDKETLTAISALRSNKTPSNDAERNELQAKVNTASRNMQVAFENYPELRAHEAIQKAMNENSYLQKEITAAREVYNDAVLRWNTAIYEWPCKMIVAAKRGYTTRIPFATDAETKEKARSVFF